MEQVQTAFHIHSLTRPLTNAPMNMCFPSICEYTEATIRQDARTEEEDVAEVTLTTYVNSKNTVYPTYKQLVL